MRGGEGVEDGARDEKDQNFCLALGWAERLWQSADAATADRDGPRFASGSEPVAADGAASKSPRQRLQQKKTEALV
ncbi:unnamed protein product [Lampetra planeri]